MTESVEILAADSPHALDDLAERLRAPLEEVGAERAIAFGSYARGTADAYSDLDLVVVMRTDAAGMDRCRRLFPLLRAVPVTINLFVYTPEEFEEGLARGIGVFDAIAREGVTIHARCGG